MSFEWREMRDWGKGVEVAQGSAFDDDVRLTATM
jgi:hypothetical protein